MRKRMMTASLTLALAALAAGCGGADSNSSNTANTNASRSAVETAPGERTAPDNSVITTETANGVTTEMRTFSTPDSPVSRVVVTTRDGRRTARVYYRTGEVREVTTEGDVERALDASADTLVAIAGKTVDVTKDVGREIGDKAEDVKDQTVSGAKTVGREAADKAEDVGGEAASGAKAAGKKTVKGAKKVGGAVKDAITP